MNFVSLAPRELTKKEFKQKVEDTNAKAGIESNFKPKGFCPLADKESIYLAETGDLGK